MAVDEGFSSQSPSALGLIGVKTWKNGSILVDFAGVRKEQRWMIEMRGSERREAREAEVLTP